MTDSIPYFTGGSNLSYKLRGVVCGPLAESPCRCSRDRGNGGCNKLRAQASSKRAGIRAYVYARRRTPLWGLVSCGRLSIGQLTHLRRTAAVANRRAGCQPAPQIGAKLLSFSGNIQFTSLACMQRVRYSWPVCRSVRVSVATMARTLLFAIEEV